MSSNSSLSGKSDALIRDPLNEEQLKRLIREVPDFPKPGILFYDITTLLKDKAGFARLVDRFSEHYRNQKIDLVLGMEARGFIFAPALAYSLKAGFVPVRKPGKLPFDTHSFHYELEYGSDTLEMHVDGIRAGQRVLIVDDLLATGGTVEACCRLVEKAGATVVGCAFLIELADLQGAQRLADYHPFSLIRY